MWCIDCLMMMMHKCLEILKNAKTIKWGSFNFSVKQTLLLEVWDLPILFVKIQLLFFSGFEGESDSTRAKQQMEVVRCEITRCCG